VTVNINQLGGKRSRRQDT